MRILHAIATMAPRDGGPSKACFEMARAVARRGHEVSIFTTDKDGPGRLDVPVDSPVERDGVTIRYFPVHTPRFWGTSWPMARALAAEIPGFDVVHLHSLYMFHDMIVGRECRRAGVPYLLRPHGTLDPYLHARRRWRKTFLEALFQDRVTRNASAIHFTTEEEMALAAPHVFGVRGVVIPNGIDAEDYEDLPPRGSFRSRHPEMGEAPLVLFLGRINFKKGLDILADAFAKVVQARPDAWLVVAGPDGGVQEDVRARMAAHGYGPRVIWPGMITGRDKLALFADADLFVLPSYSENFGIAVVEAMACGLPVAISDKVNLWHEVADAGAGWVTPTLPEPFADAILAALADPAAAREKGAHGRRLVAERFRWPQIGRALEETYASLA